VHID